MATAFIAFGSNISEPIVQIHSAFSEVANLPETELLLSSNLYRNPPVGFLDQPNFINAVAKISTKLSANELLSNLLSIEDQHQRLRAEENGPRTLDLDLLLYDDLVLKSANLEIPHPRMKERGFVLLPLAEIEPTLVLPCGTDIQLLLKRCNLEGFECIV
jgi:2-amino-4-hydroxy-6-hydroxymethyldihydropteridine diphosphokinase